MSSDDGPCRRTIRRITEDQDGGVEDLNSCGNKFNSLRVKNEGLWWNGRYSKKDFGNKVKERIVRRYTTLANFIPSNVPDVKREPGGLR